MRRSRVDWRQVTVSMSACDGTDYRFGHNLSIAQESHVRRWPCSASNSCVGSYRTFGVGPDIRRIEGNEKDARCVGVNITAQLTFRLLQGGIPYKYARLLEGKFGNEAEDLQCCYPTVVVVCLFKDHIFFAWWIVVCWWCPSVRRYYFCAIGVTGMSSFFIFGFINCKYGEVVLD